MVDIHTHILPGIDDGAASWEESYRMAAMAADSGVDTIVCTHHANLPGLYANYDSASLDALFDLFCRGLAEGGFPLRAVRGMEIFTTPDICRKIYEGRLRPIGETDYFLVEFSFEESPEYMQDALYDMLRRGMLPIIAHPERYYALQDDPSFLSAWIAHGVLSQVNKGSLLGKFGAEAERTALAFMEHAAVTCVASDAHSPDVRTTDMREIRRFLERRYSGATARALLDVNPRRIVYGRAPARGPSR